MSASSTRSSHAWTITAHAIAAALLGAIEAMRLGSGQLALVLVPVFAATGLIIGLVIAGAARLVVGRPAWQAALGLAAPSLLVTVPIGHTLFVGAYAQTLPLAGLLPYLVPLAAWLGIAVVVWGGRRLADGDLTSRGIAIMAAAGLIGAVLWVDRNVLGTGYHAAQIGATLAVIVLAGVTVRLARRVTLRPSVAMAVALLVAVMAVAAVTGGLADPSDRRLLANRGDQGRDLVALWRQILDVDRDGSSAVLGGGDCDDRDPNRYPGALDRPGDGVDQDCDGSDARIPPPPPALPTAVDLAAWHASPAVAAVLDRTRGMNLVVITVDALRYDLLAPGAPHREDFPRLTTLIDESVLFTRAVSPATGTDISLSTLVSGRLDPFQHVAVTLPEAIRALGRRTTSALPSEVTRHVGEVLLGRGFDSIRPVYTDWEQENVGSHISAGTTTAEGLRALDKAGAAAWFTWLHYFDVHEHHQLTVPAELKQQVWDGGSDRVHRYRALLRAVDRSVGRFLDELETRGLGDRTIVMFASDHGEALDDDPRLPATHGQVTYAPLVRIPIAFRVPGIAAGVRTDPVSLVDIAPTLISLLGDAHAMGTIDGFDLVPALFDGPAALRPPADRALVIHEEKQWSVVEWPYQLIVRPAEDLVELYDIERDPTASTDLAPQMAELTSRLRARYAEVPVVRVDRTASGKAWREQQARPPPPRARP